MLFSLLRLASLGTIRLFRSGLRPACLDHLDIDLEASTNESAISTSNELLLKVTDQVEDGDLDRAVAIWSDHVETHLLDHCKSSLCQVEGIKVAVRRLPLVQLNLPRLVLKVGGPRTLFRKFILRFRYGSGQSK